MKIKNLSLTHSLLKIEFLYLRKSYACPKWISYLIQNLTNFMFQKIRPICRFLCLKFAPKVYDNENRNIFLNSISSPYNEHFYSLKLAPKAKHSNTVMRALIKCHLELKSPLMPLLPAALTVNAYTNLVRRCSERRTEYKTKRQLSNCLL